MTPEEFRRHGREVVDWIADYMERVESYPVLSRVSPGDVRAALPTSPPQTGEAFDALLRDLEEIILPGITHWQSPNFFAFFPANNSGPSILGDLLSAGLGIQGMLWATSPACTELETHVLDWLVNMLGLPDRFHSSSPGGGVIQDTASSGALCALIAARERATEGQSNVRGSSGELTAYASTHAHSSIEKAVRIAGVGSANLRLVDVDETFAMRPERLATVIEADRSAGRRPCFVCATVGTTSSMAMDPLRPIGEICQDQGVWFHVDAAMAGTAAVCPEFRAMHDGLELAQSYNFNPHKWMLTNFDCSALYVSDRAALINALSILPEYLKNKATESGAVIDYRDWQIPLGRRFRALKLWFVIRWYGVEGIRRMVRDHVHLAQEFAQWIEADPAFDLAAPVTLNLVCFRHEGGDAVNQAIMEVVNESGRIYLTHTRLDGRLTLRLAVGQAKTRRAHVEQAWAMIREVSEQVAVGHQADG
jgi:aromatic-L-amino-acid decarboxylase